MSNVNEQNERRVDHGWEILNQPKSVRFHSDFNKGLKSTFLKVLNENLIDKQEVTRAIKSFKNNKLAVVDHIAFEMLKH